MRKVELNDLYSFKFVSSPAWSPAGDKAVFTVSQANEDTNGYFNDLWLYEDGAARPLTASHDAKSAIWLDNDTLLFSALRCPKDKEAAKKEPLTVFYSLSLKGGEAQEYMRLPLKGASLKLLQGGSFACVAKYDFGGEDNELCTVYEELPFWANGAGYTNKLRNRLYLVKDGKPEAITGEHEDVHSWNVCGNDIAFVAHEYENVNGTAVGVFLWQDGVRKTLIPDNATPWSCRWAGFYQGKPVAALTDCKAHGRNEIPEMYIFEGGEPKMLFKAEEVHGSGITGDSSYGGGAGIVYDGDALYYTTVVDTLSVIRRFSDKGLETLLETTGSVSSITVKNGKILASYIAQNRLPELCEVVGGMMIQKTMLNEALYTERKIAMPEPVTAKNDGWDIHGYVLRPTDYEEGKSYPAIMDIHGGPFAAFGTPYFHEMQVWAAKGYFVFYCNPRGGLGRGGEFGDIRGKYGTIDYDDLMAFCDEVLKQYPMIDKKRVGVTGGSYGGYMTNWIIGHTDRFAAAASQRCISNWVSFYCASDIGPNFGFDQCAGNPWDDTEKLWWHSPLKYAKNVKTPTMFIHSDQDYRCWMAEVLQMFSALKLQGIDSRICLFHGENHELSRSGKPKNRIRRIEEITAWMDKYLK